MIRLTGQLVCATFAEAATVTRYLAGHCSRTRPWRGWGQVLSDLTRVKSSKHQPQRRDVAGDSVKI